VAVGPAKALVEEIWLLWRYLGGMKMGIGMGTELDMNANARWAGAGDAGDAGVEEDAHFDPDQDSNQESTDTTGPRRSR